MLFHLLLNRTSSVQPNLQSKRIFSPTDFLPFTVKMNLSLAVPFKAKPSDISKSQAEIFALVWTRLGPLHDRRPSIHLVNEQRALRARLRRRRRRHYPQFGGRRSDVGVAPLLPLLAIKPHTAHFQPSVGRRLSFSADSSVAPLTHSSHPTLISSHLTPKPSSSSRP